jgi:HEAT repeat protein
LLLGLGAARALRRWRAWRLARREGTWREGMLEALRDPTRATLPRIAAPELAAFLALWNAACESQSDAGRDNLAALLRFHDLDRRALRMLRRRSPRLRLIAITAMGHLKEPRAWRALARFAESRAPVISFAAARALLRIDAPGAMELLAHPFAARLDWPLTRIGTLFEQLGPAQVTRPLVDMLAAKPGGGLDRAMQLARFGDRRRIAPLVRNWLSNSATHPDVLVAALEYAGESEDLPWARTAANHEDWRVRAAAARALARIGGRQELPALLDLLRDPVWRVRYRASQALTRLEGLTPIELEALRENARDAFAADMLAQALAEMKLA